MKDVKARQIKQIQHCEIHIRAKKNSVKLPVSYNWLHSVPDVVDNMPEYYGKIPGEEAQFALGCPWAVTFDLMAVSLMQWREEKR